MHIYNSIRPFYLFAKLFGLWPQSIKKTPRPWSVPALIWTLCILACYVWVISMIRDMWFLDFIAEATKTTVAKWTQLAQLYLVLSLCVLLTVYNLFNHWNLWALLEGIRHVDDTLQKRFHVILDYEYNVRFLVIVGCSCCCVFFGLFVSFDLFICWINECMNHMIVFIVGLSVFALMTEVSMSLFLLLHVKKKFFNLNCILRQLLIDDPLSEFTILDSAEFFHVQEIINVYGKGVKYTKPEETLSQQRNRAKKCNVFKLVFTEQRSLNEILETLSDILRAYSSVCDCVHLWNRTFAIPFLGILTITYCNAICSAFVAIRSFSQDVTGPALIFAAFNSTWLLMFMSTLILLLIITNSTVAEASRTGLIINRVMRLAQNDTLIERLMLASEQTHWNHVRITCGLFAYDWTLILAAFGSMTNYLMFLLQLKF